MLKHHSTNRTSRLVLAAVVFLAIGTPGLAQGPFERFRRPVAVTTDEALHLFVQRLKGEEQTVAAWRRDEHGSWSRVAELRGDYSTIIWHDGHFYMFLKTSVVRLDDQSFRNVGHADWWFNWRPQAAMVIDGTLMAFGAGPDGGLHLASAPLAVADEGAASRSSRFLRADWQRRPLYQPGPGAPRCIDVRTLLTAESRWVFWVLDRHQESKALNVAELTADGLGEPDTIATARDALGFAVAEHDGRPMVVFTSLPARLREKRLLAYRVRKDEKWPPFHTIESITNEPVEQTVEMVAVTWEDSAHLFLSTEHRILVSQFDGADWSVPRPIMADPVWQGMVDHLVWLVAIAVISVIVLIVSLVRNRSLPRRVEIAGLEYTLASWPRRVAAYLIDLILIVLVLAVLSNFAGISSWVELLIGFSALELLYFSIFEARTGHTFGKQAMGIIVVSRNGGYPSASEALLRNAIRAAADTLAIPLSWLGGSFVLLNTRGSQRLGDVLAGTYVVREQNE